MIFDTLFSVFSGFLLNVWTLGHLNSNLTLHINIFFGIFYMLAIISSIFNRFILHKHFIQIRKLVTLYVLDSQCFSPDVLIYI